MRKWDTIWKGEHNSILLLILTLYWWMAASAEGSKAQGEYKSALEEVTWLMPLLVSNVPSADNDRHMEEEQLASTSGMQRDALDSAPAPIACQQSPPRMCKRAADQLLREVRPCRKSRH